MFLIEGRGLDAVRSASWHDLGVAIPETDKPALRIEFDNGPAFGPGDEREGVSLKLFDKAGKRIETPGQGVFRVACPDEAA